MNDASTPATPWTREQRALLDAILDALIPPGDDGRPGAGELGVADAIAGRLDATPGLDVMIAGGLAKAAELAPEGAPSAQARPGFAKELSRLDPGFFFMLQLLTYIEYYSHPAVGPHLGLPDRPPQPEGYSVPADDDLAELLAPVVARGRCYREV